MAKRAGKTVSDFVAIIKDVRKGCRSKFALVAAANGGGGFEVVETGNNRDILFDAAMARKGDAFVLRLEPEALGGMSAIGWLDVLLNAFLGDIPAYRKPRKMGAPDYGTT